MTRISEVMTRDVHIADPNQTIREAAKAMADSGIGGLPVGENDRLIGMITDRDIVMRAVAKGKKDDTPIRDVMTDRIRYCFDDDDVDHVAENMAELGVHRLPVVNHDKRLVGIVSRRNIGSHAGNGKAPRKASKSAAAGARQ